MRRRIAALVASVLVAITAVPVAAAWQMRALGSLSGEVRNEANRVRAERGLAPLRNSAALGRAAAQHVYEMAVLGYFGHGSPNHRSVGERLAQYYPPFRRAYWQVGEDLLWWAAPIRAKTVVELWLASAPHRRELLDSRFREIGVSSLDVSAAGGIFGGRRVTLVAADFGVR